MRTYKCINCGKEAIWSHQKVNKYCSNQCQKQYETKKRIKQWLNEGISWKHQTPTWAKNYLIEQRGYACEVCKMETWMDKKITLEVDHIDGHHYNNTEDNLRLICPNCHSQTVTYKNKNKGNGREYR